MLMLSRKVGQKIIINENITIVISGVEGSIVTLGIEAPKHIPVDREEVHKIKNPDYSPTGK